MRFKMIVAAGSACARSLAMQALHHHTVFAQVQITSAPAFASSAIPLPGRAATSGHAPAP